MDGLLVIDKPVGPTSHDIVSRVRRALRERRVGHTGTLDPMASGVLPLVLGRATRLARFLSSTDKHYLGTIRLGWPTDTYDALGQPSRSACVRPIPSTDAVERALDAFRGTILQRPPAFSAKKIEGRRSYQLARAHARDAASAGVPALTTPCALPAPVSVTVRKAEIVSREGDLVTLSIVCSTGFYVRSLANDLGEALGVGAHLAALRRTQTSGVTLSDALAVEDVEAGGPGLERARAAVISLERMLPGLPRIDLTAEGTDRVAKGRDVGVQHLSSPAAEEQRGTVRLFGPDGALLAIAEPSGTPGVLHPAVVLM